VSMVMLHRTTSGLREDAKPHTYFKKCDSTRYSVPSLVAPRKTTLFSVPGSKNILGTTGHPVPAPAHTTVKNYNCKVQLPCL
jgi:hypothetical protein